MGNTHSSSTDAVVASSKDSSMPASCVCCLPPRSGFIQLLEKLRRSVKHHLTLRTRKRRCGFQRGCGARAALLRPMPRCSSFGSCSTLLTPKKRCSKKKATPSDTHYAQWKCMFEHATSKCLAPPAQRPHDISEALSGQTTPRGFPSHTDARRCPLPVDQPPPYDCFDDNQTRRRLSFRLPGSNQGSVRRLTARQRVAQAQLEAQLQRELCDLEDYYGGFYYTRRNERRI